MNMQLLEGLTVLSSHSAELKIEKGSMNQTAAFINQNIKLLKSIVSK